MTFRATVIAGLMVRRSLRRWLLEQRVQFTEDRGLLDSQFTMEVTARQAAAIRSVATALEED